ncbi:hypothetical protein jhhlp_002906 [Lomentospora prolificans]|uniref:Cytochrome P450 n=1 Tax=Lomentospora prolificans TaxID=41688 RepID=A0A2N3NFE6_9PEZI|nr:hypothetical protein jhhlp_002906 [Lomentospora prolificans]
MALEEGIDAKLRALVDLIRRKYMPTELELKPIDLGTFIRHGVEQRDCQSEILFQIIAGSDTTATAIRGTLLNLMTAPHASQRLQREIDEAMTNGDLSSPVKAEEGWSLRYLQVGGHIRRPSINIPFSGLVMKEVPPEGDTINGQFVPGGTRIGQNFLTVQRSIAIFGDIADLLWSERWLDIDEAKLTQWRHHVELVFGSRRWGCSGKSVTFMEFNKVYVEIYPSKPIETTNKNIFFQKNMSVRVTGRFPEAT